ncbi:MAG: hypothetical protein O3A84_03020, partial [Proteobacteria bacterium]|nr:hypothetical protein [Pseudomonadota bacterium]
MTHDCLRHRFRFARHKLGDLLLPQGNGVNAHFVDASVERLSAPVGADGPGRRPAWSEFPGLLPLGDFLSIDIQPQQLSIEGSRHVMPLAVDEFRGLVGGGNLRV